MKQKYDKIINSPMITFKTMGLFNFQQIIKENICYSPRLYPCYGETRRKYMMKMHINNNEAIG